MARLASPLARPAAVRENVHEVQHRGEETKAAAPPKKFCRDQIYRHQAISSTFENGESLQVWGPIEYTGLFATLGPAKLQPKTFDSYLQSRPRVSDICSDTFRQNPTAWKYTVCHELARSRSCHRDLACGPIASSPSVALTKSQQYGTAECGLEDVAQVSISLPLKTALYSSPLILPLH